MTYSRIMVHLELEQQNEAALRVAAGLVEQFQADVIGIAACNPQPPYYAGGSIAQEFVARDRANIKRLLTECEANFREAISGRAKNVEWRCALDTPAQYVSRQARAADIILTGANRDGLLIDPLRRLDPSDLVMSAGRPVLIVPPQADPLRMGCILLAWKDTHETRRAAWDALPLMKKADEVAIVEIVEAEGDQESARRRVDDVQAWLNRHGVTAKSYTPPIDGTIPGQLETLADEFLSDLVVAGAYGHNRWREVVLGGVTRDLITRASHCSLISR